MSLVELFENGDLEGVKAALQSGADVNTKCEMSWTGLMWAVEKSHNSVVELLLNTADIDLNLKTARGGGNCAMPFLLTLTYKILCLSLKSFCGGWCVGVLI